uniref:Transmembrane protein 268 isoform X1 n=1 Tax=Pogona vitticeps TaxID=103695 RepID=A0ABM5F5D3_9SAUR
MACGTSQGSSAKEEERLLSVFASPRQELSNGQVLLVLTAHETSFPSTLNTNLWAERLKKLGIQVTPDQWKNLIQGTVLQPEVKQYLFYNSRGFRITIAVVLYVTLWINLYSTLMVFSVGPSWEVSIVATVVALVVALAVQLIVYRHQHKWNANTDMRLSAANEVFMKQDFLVGLTDLPHKLHSIPQLWFVHFAVGPCLRSLEDTVAKMERLQRTALKSKQDEICIVLEMAVAPSLGRKLPSALEESPLLPERTKSNQGALTCRETLRLLPDGPPEEMAMHLLTVFASYYIRLLVLGQLPKVPARRHADLGHIPCLCQFIETRVLGKRS